MQETKHTSGPWQLSRDGMTIFAGTDGAGILIRGVEQVVPHVAYIPRNGFAATIAEQQGNARLIAAAPDLLSALNRVREECVANAGSDDPQFYAPTAELMSAVVSAIAKAEGK